MVSGAEMYVRRAIISAAAHANSKVVSGLSSCNYRFAAYHTHGQIYVVLKAPVYLSPSLDWISNAWGSAFQQTPQQKGSEYYWLRPAPSYHVRNRYLVRSFSSLFLTVSSSGRSLCHFQPTPENALKPFPKPDAIS